MELTRMKIQSWIFVILSAVSAISGQSEDIVITPSGGSHTRPLGSSIVFTCTAVGLSPTVRPELRWKDDEGRDITETTGTLYIEPDGLQSLKLYITSIIANDAGTYSCSGLINGNTVTKTVTLLLYKDITFDDAPSLQYPRIYTDALIKCRVSGQPIPTVTWRHGGQKIESGGRYEYESDGLRITNITEEDNGRYICRAEVAAEGRLKEQQIDVEAHIPPKMTEKLINTEGIEDQEVTMQCKATGKPSPKYEFYKNNIDAPLWTRDHIIVDGNKGEIHFRPIKKDDEATYTCKAINDVGEDISTGFLKVIVPPRVWELRNTTAKEGDKGVLLCRSTGDPPPQMTFRKSPDHNYDYAEGENEGGRVIVENINPGELRLTVNNLSPSDTSNYTCSATNAGGNWKQNGTIGVQFAPRFDPDHPRRVYSWAGKTRNITCTALGEPEPSIRWYRKNEWIRDTNETFKIYQLGRISVLQVKVRDGDINWIFDFYACRAVNDHGQKEILIELSRATVPDKPKSVEVKDQSPTMVTLTVVPPDDNGGIPVYGYRVEYEDTIQDFNLGEEIRVENLRPSTDYIFRIRAKNEVGVSDIFEYIYRTEPIREPYPIIITSDPEGRYPYSYVMYWEKPRTGGLPIKEYWFMYRRVQVYEGTWDFQKPLEGFTTVVQLDDPQRPMMTYTLEGLKPNAYYEVKVTARNDIGESVPRPFIFKTEEDPNPTILPMTTTITTVSPGLPQVTVSTNDRNFIEKNIPDPPVPKETKVGVEPQPAQKEVTLGTGAIIGIVVAVFFLFLLIVDVSCYFMNDCGVLMCVCVHLCGKQQPGSKERAMEEGERRVAEQPIQETKVAPDEALNAQPPLSQIQAPMPAVLDDHDDIKKPIPMDDNDTLKKEISDDDLKKPSADLIIEDQKDRLKEEDEDEDSVRLKENNMDEEEVDEKSPLTMQEAEEIDQGQEATEVKVIEDGIENEAGETPREGDAD